MSGSFDRSGRRRWLIVVAAIAAILLGVTLGRGAVVGRGDTVDGSQDQGALPRVTTATTRSPVTTTGVLVDGEPLGQAAEPGFINPCHVTRVAVDAAGIDLRIPAGSRGGEIEPGFRMCHVSEAPGPGWASPHSGLYTGSVWSDDEAERVLEQLFGEWTSTGASTWSIDGSFAAVAVLEAPYLFVVTDNDFARAMRVAQAAATELASWEPDPDYVCGLIERGGSGLVADSVNEGGPEFEQYPTGADSLCQVCEAEQGSELSQLHLFWRVPATTAEDAAQLLQTADDLPLPADTQWEAFTPGTWIGRYIARTDAAGDDDFWAVAVSTDPYFFIITHASKGDALEIATEVFNEAIERMPFAEAP